MRPELYRTDLCARNNRTNPIPLRFWVRKRRYPRNPTPIGSEAESSITHIRLALDYRRQVHADVYTT